MQTTTTTPTKTRRQREMCLLASDYLSLLVEQEAMVEQVVSTRLATMKQEMEQEIIQQIRNNKPSY